MLEHLLVSGANLGELLFMPHATWIMLLRASILSPPIQGENSAHTKETNTDQMQQRSMGAALKQFEVQREGTTYVPTLQMVGGGG